MNISGSVHQKLDSVTANTRGGFTRNSAPLWARGQDAFLVIRRSPDRSQPTAMFAFM